MSTFIPPNKILISSDGSELDYIGYNPKDNLYTYEYTKGETKVGRQIRWTKEYIEVQLKNYFKSIPT